MVNDTHTRRRRRTVGVPGLGTTRMVCPSICGFVGNFVPQNGPIYSRQTPKMFLDGPSIALLHVKDSAVKVHIKDIKILRCFQP